MENTLKAVADGGGGRRGHNMGTYKSLFIGKYKQFVNAYNVYFIMYVYMIYNMFHVSKSSPSLLYTYFYQRQISKLYFSNW